MSTRLVNVVFEAEYDLTIAEPYDSDAVKQALQDELGHTGIVVTEIFVAEGASDL